MIFTRSYCQRSPFLLFPEKSEQAFEKMLKTILQENYENDAKDLDSPAGVKLLILLNADNFEYLGVSKKKKKWYDYLVKTRRSKYF